MNYLINSMEFANQESIKQPRGGLILEARDERDHVLGSALSLPIINESGQWRDFAPIPELQRNKHGDVYGCVSFSYNSIHEFLYKKQYGTELNFSDRFTVVGSGTIPYQGNGKRTVAEWGRKNGWVEESQWAFPSEMTVDEYYNDGKVPQELLNEGKQNTSKLEKNYQWLPGNSIENIKEGLKISPVQVDVERYQFNDQDSIINNGSGYFHEVAIFGYGENYWEIWDSENLQFIKADFSYNFGSPMIHSLKKKNMAKIYKKKGEPALYFLNPKDQKLVSFSDGVISGGDLFKTLFTEYYFDEFDEFPYPIADYSIKTV